MKSWVVMLVVGGSIGVMTAGCGGVSEPAGVAQGGSAGSGGSNTAGSGSGNTQKGGSGPAAGGAATGGEAGAGAGANIVLHDENNYLSSSVLTIPSVETAAGNFQMCWDQVHSDLECHAVAPLADIDNVSLLRFLNLSEAEVAARLARAQLAQSEIDGYIEYNTDKLSLCASLSAMSVFGTPIDIAQEYFVSAEHTYLLLFTKGITPGVGARSMMFVKPTADSPTTMVNAPNGCELRDFSADLTSLTPVSVPLAGPWRVEWRDVTRDSQGNALPYEAIDSALIGFYEGMSVPELEDQILDIELIATSLWEIPVTGGSSTDLANAQQRGTGELFTGFEGYPEGVWTFALMCSTCQSSAPLVLTVLSPE